MYGEDLDLALRLLPRAGRPRSRPRQSPCISVPQASATGPLAALPRRVRTRILLAALRGAEGSAALRAVVTEAIVVVGDALSRATSPRLRGRIAGWRRHAGLDRRPPPPRERPTGAHVRREPASSPPDLRSVTTACVRDQASLPGCDAPLDRGSSFLVSIGFIGPRANTKYGAARRVGRRNAPFRSIFPARRVLPADYGPYETRAAS